jgi:hypothetical protein
MGTSKLPGTQAILCAFQELVSYQVVESANHEGKLHGACLSKIAFKNGHKELINGDETNSSYLAL